MSNSSQSQEPQKSKLSKLSKKAKPFKPFKPYEDETKQSNQLVNQESIDQLVAQQPLIQHAQRCFVCGDYLYGDQSVSIYNGSIKQYNGWLTHDYCITL